MKRISILWLAVLVLMLMMGCAPKPAATPAPTTPAAKAVATPAPTTTPPPKPAWQEEWERVVAAGKKEGVVSFYAAPVAEFRKALTEGFEKAIPGIKLEYTPAGSADVANKLIAEKKAGMMAADVINTGTTTGVLSLKANQILAPMEPALILPEVKDTSKWLENRLDWADNDNLILAMAALVPPSFIVNSDLVDPKEFKSYQDLLNPKWKGKIALRNPVIAGSAHSEARFWLARFGPDYIRAMKKQEPVETRDERELVDWVVKGKFPIGIGSSPSQIIPYLAAGVTNLAMISYAQVGEAGYTSPGQGALMWPMNPPHPNAAKVFINWLLSRDGQEYFTEGLGYPSRRLDVSQKGVPTWTIPPKVLPPGKKYFEFYSEKAQAGPDEAELDRLLKELGYGR